ncbi:MAG: hypothetical protein IPM82_32790 [Saprospiraceae bacterium]|nr:hypothetical protein [Saprospiraceae bacterium]
MKTGDPIPKIGRCTARRMLANLQFYSHPKLPKWDSLDKLQSAMDDLD